MESSASDSYEVSMLNFSIAAWSQEGAKVSNSDVWVYCPSLFAELRATPWGSARFGFGAQTVLFFILAMHLPFLFIYLKRMFWEFLEISVVATSQS